VGGGNSGFEEGIFLTRFANQVDIVEYLPEVRASQVLQDAVSNMPNMKVTTNHAVRSLKGHNKLEAVVAENRATGEVKEWDYDGVFVFVGLSPNSEMARRVVKVNEQGFIQTDLTLMTSVPGIFAAGDARDGSTKQAAAAAGEGATAALMMREYLKKL
jgi:thioredoxin reductase (NADPH)